MGRGEHPRYYHHYFLVADLTALPDSYRDTIIFRFSSLVLDLLTIENLAPVPLPLTGTSILSLSVLYSNFVKKLDDY